MELCDIFRVDFLQCGRSSERKIGFCRHRTTTYQQLWQGHGTYDIPLCYADRINFRGEKMIVDSNTSHSVRSCFFPPLKNHAHVAARPFQSNLCDQIEIVSPSDSGGVRDKSKDIIRNKIEFLIYYIDS